MQIDNKLLKHYLRNVLFINGTAYAGKSTMVRMLAETYNLLHCGENYDCVPQHLINPQTHPNLCYFQTMRDWQEFINRTPQQYSDWIQGVQHESAEFEIMHLISVSQTQRTIVDTNIPVDVLREIADYHQVAVMLSPQSMAVEHFFDRNDPEKAFLNEQILQADDPEKTMQNFLACMAEINSQQIYDQFAHSGFFALVREDTETDTRTQTLHALARHFGLTD
ncbi:MAG: hypothetical protein FWB76_07490 [Oscillospiraceae bacterium]|nr:hypothetical protein [Oscillospiraceae bacterium]MCL2195775.1 hypothetical protein [Oscillospiraceae bacterium]